MVLVMRIICNSNVAIGDERALVAGLPAVCYRSGKNQTQ